MTALHDSADIEALNHALHATASLWGLSPDTEIRLVTVSENATFEARDPARDAPVMFRVHRPGYHDRAEIASELAWIAALLRDGTLEATRPLPLVDGTLIAPLDTPTGPRDVVAFAHMPGRAPAADADLVPRFRDLGAISARLHAHARAWTPPPGFTRKTWNVATTIGPRGHWGDWRAAPGLDASGTRLLERLADALAARLAAHGTGPARFGLIHADLRLDNLLVDEDGRIGVIDFDDCGFGWFMYDFAAAVSFHEHEAFVPDLEAAWLEGYRATAPLAAEDAAILPTMVMLRRLLLTAWIASHREAPTAAALGAGYAAGTVTLAERYLATGGR